MGFLPTVVANWAQNAGGWLKELMVIRGLPEVLKVPPLDPFDEDEPPAREIDHTGDDPGPENLPPPFVPSQGESR